MSHEEYENRLQLFIDGELSPHERSAFEGHLRGCSDCREKLNSLLHMTSLVGRMREYRVPVSFNRRVLKELGFLVTPRWPRVVSVAATSVVGGWLGLVSLWVGHHGAGSLPGLVRLIRQLPKWLEVVVKVLEPIGTLLKAGAVVLRGLGGFYLFAALLFASLVALIFWFLISQRMRPTRVFSVI